ncbi:hypothetical protein Alches_20830 [Alicyclobacillus hesperidum subsp. aegles]|nr:hypothetical protein Alches_20830 [Alicyclobacillus hesperidum subsp. aegles]
MVNKLGMWSYQVSVAQFKHPNAKVNIIISDWEINLVKTTGLTENVFLNS